MGDNGTVNYEIAVKAGVYNVGGQLVRVDVAGNPVFGERVVRAVRNNVLTVIEGDERAAILAPLLAVRLPR